VVNANTAPQVKASDKEPGIASQEPRCNPDSIMLSILSPSLNYGRFIEDAIASVELQGGTTAQHIVADGGSVDGTRAILQSAPASVEWLSEPDQGQSDALSKAFRLSRGEWLGCLNCDEFYLPGAFQALAGAIRAYPDADVFYGDFVNVDSDGCLLRILPEHRFNSFVLRYAPPCFIPSCATFIRRSMMPERLWDRQCTSMMDWDLFLELSRTGSRFVHIRRPFAAFRVHPGQVTAGAGAQTDEEFRLIRTRHGIPTSQLAVRLGSSVGHLVHGCLKLGEGGYLRQIRAQRELAGANLRWFTGEGEALNVRRLLTNIYGLQTRVVDTG
jgi:Glycosyl transferase family 2